jgi:hypothetical protein
MNEWPSLTETKTGLAFTAANARSTSSASDAMDAGAAAAYLWEGFLDHGRSRIR